MPLAAAAGATAGAAAIGRRRRALLTGAQHGGAAWAAASVRAAASSMGGGGLAPTDWLLHDTAGLRLARHPLPDYPMSEEERRSLANATEVINKLTEAGCLALIAGGWVRDKFLGRPSSDIDIATSATNAQIKHLFDRVIDLPRNTVKLAHKGELFEVATFRGYSRSEGLASAALDAEARDFTVNALYYCPRHGAVLDFVGGVEDMQKRSLRLSSGIMADQVGRLLEDPLRVLRAVRFAVTLGLKLSPETAKLLAQHAHRCSVDEGIPARRIWLELHKFDAAEAKSPGTWQRSLALAYHLGLLPHLFPWLRGGGPSAAQRAVVASARFAVLAADADGSSSAAASGGGGGGGAAAGSGGGGGGAAAGGGGGEWAAASSGGGGSGAAAGSSSSGVGAVASSSGGGGGVPLELRVAALVHPSSSRAVYEMAFRYFKTPDERSAIDTLALAAHLARQQEEAESAAASAQPPAAAGGSAAAAAAGGGGGGAASAGERQWARVYGHERGEVMLRVLAAWMPEETAGRFLEFHRQRRGALAPLVAAAAEARAAERAAAAAEEEAVFEARRRARLEAAGIHLPSYAAAGGGSSSASACTDADANAGGVGVGGGAGAAINERQALKLCATIEALGQGGAEAAGSGGGGGAAAAERQQAEAQQ